MQNKKCKVEDSLFIFNMETKNTHIEQCMTKIQGEQSAKKLKNRFFIKWKKTNKTPKKSKQTTSKGIHVIARYDCKKKANNMAYLVVNKTDESMRTMPKQPQKQKTVKTERKTHSKTKTPNRRNDQHKKLQPRHTFDFISKTKNKPKKAKRWGTVKCKFEA